jgi:hypothetical protein
VRRSEGGGAEVGNAVMITNPNYDPAKAGHQFPGKGRGPDAQAAQTHRGRWISRT